MMANRLFHFFRLRGEYNNHALKNIVTVLGAVFVINKRSMMHLMYMGILVGIGLLLSQTSAHGGVVALFRSDYAFTNFNAAAIVGYALAVWCILSLAGASLVSVTATSFNHANDNIMINYLRANPAKYAMSRILADCVSGTVLYFPTMLLAMFFINDGFVVWQAVVVTVAFVAARLLGEAINMFIFKRTAKHFGYMALSVPGAAVIYIGSITVPYFFGILNFAAILQSPFAIIPPVVIGGLAILYIKNYRYAAELFRDKITCYDNFAQKYTQQKTSTAFATTANWSKGIQTEQLEVDNHANKKGLDYLNAIFFDRHKRFFARKLRMRCLILLAPLVAAALFAAYSFIVLGEAPHTLIYGEYSPGVYGWLSMTSVIMFVVYTASMGRVVTASVFTNCDIQMLNYPYYRQAKTIFASFKMRFFVILKYNAVLAFVIFATVVGAVVVIFGQVDIAYIVLFFAATIFTCVFFTFNDLFLYYVIQPYDSEGKDTSVPSKIINFVVYGVSYITFWFFRLSLVPYTITIAVVTVLYLGVGFILLYKLAPSRFKLR